MGERQKADEVLEWITTQCRLMWDELDAGVFHTESDDFLTAMAADWRQLANKVHEANEACTKMVNEIEAWVDARQLSNMKSEAAETIAMTAHDINIQETTKTESED